MTHYTSKQQSCKLSTKSSQNLSSNVVNNKSEWKYFHIVLFCHYFVLSQKIMSPNILYSIQLNKFVIQNLLLNDITNYCFFTCKCISCCAGSIVMAYFSEQQYLIKTNYQILKFVPITFFCHFDYFSL